VAITESSRTSKGAMRPSVGPVPEPMSVGQSERAGLRPQGHLDDDRRSGFGWIMLAFALPMLLCCGGPLIVAALAAASAATLGAVGGVIGAVLLAIAVAWWVHRRHRGGTCCPIPTQTWQK